jgi:hypothetical protein
MHCKPFLTVSFFDGFKGCKQLFLTLPIIFSRGMKMVRLAQENALKNDSGIWLSTNAEAAGYAW